MINKPVVTGEERIALRPINTEESEEKSIASPDSITTIMDFLDTGE